MPRRSARLLNMKQGFQGRLEKYAKMQRHFRCRIETPRKHASPKKSPRTDQSLFLHDSSSVARICCGMSLGWTNCSGCNDGQSLHSDFRCKESLLKKKKTMPSWRIKNSVAHGKERLMLHLSRQRTPVKRKVTVLKSPRPDNMPKSTTNSPVAVAPSLGCRLCPGVKCPVVVLEQLPMHCLLGSPVSVSSLSRVFTPDLMQRQTPSIPHPSPALRQNASLLCSPFTTVVYQDDRLSPFSPRIGVCQDSVHTKRNCHSEISDKLHHVGTDIHAVTQKTDNASLQSCIDTSLLTSLEVTNNGSVDDSTFGNLLEVCAKMAQIYPEDQESPSENLSVLHSHEYNTNDLAAEPCHQSSTDKPCPEALSISADLEGNETERAVESLLDESVQHVSEADPCTKTAIPLSAKSILLSDAGCFGLTPPGLMSTVECTPSGHEPVSSTPADQDKNHVASQRKRGRPRKYHRLAGNQGSSKKKFPQFRKSRNQMVLFDSDVKVNTGELLPTSRGDISTRLYKCSCCHYHSKDKEDKMAHFKTCHPRCTICSRFFPTQEALKSHKTECAKKSFDHCQVCDKLYLRVRRKGHFHSRWHTQLVRVARDVTDIIRHGDINSYFSNVSCDPSSKCQKCHPARVSLERDKGEDFRGKLAVVSESQSHTPCLSEPFLADALQDDSTTEVALDLMPNEPLLNSFQPLGGQVCVSPAPHQTVYPSDLQNLCSVEGQAQCTVDGDTEATHVKKMPNSVDDSCSHLMSSCQTQNQTVAVLHSCVTTQCGGTGSKEKDVFLGSSLQDHSLASMDIRNQLSSGDVTTFIDLLELFDQSDLTATDLPDETIAGLEMMDICEDVTQVQAEAEEVATGQMQDLSISPPDWSVMEKSMDQQGSFAELRQPVAAETIEAVVQGLDFRRGFESYSEITPVRPDLSSPVFSDTSGLSVGQFSDVQPNTELASFHRSSDFSTLNVSDLCKAGFFAGTWCKDGTQFTKKLSERIDLSPSNTCNSSVAQKSGTSFSQMKAVPDLGGSIEKSSGLMTDSTAFGGAPLLDVSACLTPCSSSSLLSAGVDTSSNAIGITCATHCLSDKSPTTVMATMCLSGVSDTEIVMKGIPHAITLSQISPSACRTELNATPETDSLLDAVQIKEDSLVDVTPRTDSLLYVTHRAKGSLDVPSTTDILLNMTPIADSLLGVSPTTDSLLDVTPTIDSLLDVTPTTDSLLDVTPIADMFLDTTPTTDSLPDVTPRTDRLLYVTHRAKGSLDVPSTTDILLNMTPIADSLLGVSPTTDSLLGVSPTTDSLLDVTSTTDSLFDVTPTTDSLFDVTPIADMFLDTTPTTDSLPDVTPIADSLLDVTPTADMFLDTTPTTDSLPDVTPIADSLLDVTSATDSLLDVTPTTDSLLDVTPIADSLLDVTVSTASQLDMTSSFDFLSDIISTRKSFPDVNPEISLSVSSNTASESSSEPCVPSGSNSLPGSNVLQYCPTSTGIALSCITTGSLPSPASTPSNNFVPEMTSNKSCFTGTQDAKTSSLSPEHSHFPGNFFTSVGEMRPEETTNSLVIDGVLENSPLAEGNLQPAFKSALQNIRDISPVRIATNETLCVKSFSIDQERPCDIPFSESWAQRVLICNQDKFDADICKTVDCTSVKQLTANPVAKTTLGCETVTTDTATGATRNLTATTRNNEENPCISTTEAEQSRVKRSVFKLKRGHCARTTAFDGLIGSPISVIKPLAGRTTQQLTNSAENTQPEVVLKPTDRGKVNQKAVRIPTTKDISSLNMKHTDRLSVTVSPTGESMSAIKTVSMTTPTLRSTTVSTFTNRSLAVISQMVRQSVECTSNIIPTDEYSPTIRSESMSSSKVKQIVLTTPSVKSVDVTTLNVKPVDVITPRGKHVDVTTPTGKPVDVTSQTGEHVDVTTPAGKPVDVTSRTGEHVDVTTPAVKPVDVTSQTGEHVDVTTPAVKPVDVTSQTGEHVDVTTSTGKPVDVTTPGSKQVDVTTPTVMYVDAKTRTDKLVSMTTPAVTSMNATSSTVKPVDVTKPTSVPMQTVEPEGSITLTVDPQELIAPTVITSTVMIADTTLTVKPQNMTSPAVIQEAKNLSEVSQLATKKPPVVHIARKSPAVKKIAKKSPAGAQKATKSSAVVQTAKKSAATQIVKSPAVSQVAKKSPAVIQIARKSPAVTQTARNSPAVTQKLPAVTQIARKSPAFTQIDTKSSANTGITMKSSAVTQTARKSPAITQIARKPPAVTQIATKSPAVTQTARKSPAVTQIARKSPAVTQTARNSPAVTQKLPAVTQIARKSPAFTQIDTKSPANTGITMKSSAVTQTARKSPAITQIARKPLAVTQIATKSPAVTQTARKSPAVTQIARKSPAVMQIARKSPAVTQIATKSPAITQTARKSPAVTQAARKSSTVTLTSPSTEPSNSGKVSTTGHRLQCVTGTADRQAYRLKDLSHQAYHSSLGDKSISPSGHIGKPSNRTRGSAIKRKGSSEHTETASTSIERAGDNVSRKSVVSVVPDYRPATLTTRAKRKGVDSVDYNQVLQTGGEFLSSNSGSVPAKMKRLSGYSGVPPSDQKSRKRAHPQQELKTSHHDHQTAGSDSKPDITMDAVDQTPVENQKMDSRDELPTPIKYPEVGSRGQLPNTIKDQPDNRTVILSTPVKPQAMNRRDVILSSSVKQEDINRKDNLSACGTQTAKREVIMSTHVTQLKISRKTMRNIIMNAKGKYQKKNKRDVVLSAPENIQVLNERSVSLHASVETQPVNSAAASLIIPKAKPEIIERDNLLSSSCCKEMNGRVYNLQTGPVLMQKTAHITHGCVHEEEMRNRDIGSMVISPALRKVKAMYSPHSLDQKLGSSFSANASPSDGLVTKNDLVENKTWNPQYRTSPLPVNTANHRLVNCNPVSYYNSNHDYPASQYPARYHPASHYPVSYCPVNRFPVNPCIYGDKSIAWHKPGHHLNSAVPAMHSGWLSQTMGNRYLGSLRNNSTFFTDRTSRSALEIYSDREKLPLFTNRAQPPVLADRKEHPSFIDRGEPTPPTLRRVGMVNSQLLPISCASGMKRKFLLPTPSVHRTMPSPIVHRTRISDVPLSSSLMMTACDSETFVGLPFKSF